LVIELGRQRRSGTADVTVEGGATVVELYHPDIDSLSSFDFKLLSLAGSDDSRDYAPDDYTQWWTYTLTPPPLPPPPPPRPPPPPPPPPGP
jgi:hypothetical protein